MGSEFDLVSQDAQRALEDFALDFTAALVQSGVEPWAKNLGKYRPSKALLTTFPIPLSAAGYKEFLGDVKYRDLAHKSIQLKPKTWQDGVMELASVVEAPDFTGWNDQPAAMALAADSLPNELVAALLKANATQEFDGKAFFASNHPYNPLVTGLGTFDNDHSGAFTVESLKTAKTNFRAIKGGNGKPLGLRMTHVLAPAAMEEEVKDVLEQDMVIQAVGGDFGAVDNRHKGTVIPIFSDELEDDDVFYPLALNKPGLVPWVVQDEGAPEEIVSDKSSALYAQALKVGIAYILRGNAGLLLPHSIQRFTAP